ncbi:NAD(P)H-binding protein [Saccharothrix sp. 6-C]|uniref:NAD(P)H-binding protein n=1 Tax=Saccharothrix sp. 6-C TaxID=2781735 RepID=UPI001916EF54|nr:NAD(P)H-binding protein [Saccharothrix sp. 6-C]QQQ78017.1 NAD(P)H-binding protein [Saccharothrix sp. 6-C]
MTILVLGATGKTGRRVVPPLDALGVDYRAVSRRTEIRFDWSDRSTWARALEGATAVYLVPPALNLEAAEVAEFVPQAVEAGVRRIVLLSARGIPADDGRERAVRESGVDWTVLRPTWFSQNFSEDYFLPEILAGEIVLPAGSNATNTSSNYGPHPFIDAQDIADVAVAALTQDGHAGVTYELSGPEALTFVDVVARVGEVSGRSVRITDVPAADYTAMLVQGGIEDAYAEVLTTSLIAILDGHDAALSDGVPSVLGHDGRLFGDYAKEAAAAWAIPERG